MFERPWVLLFVPVVVWLVWWLIRQKSGIGFSKLSLLRGSWALPLNLFQKIVLSIVVTSVLIALAGPVEVRQEEVVASYAARAFVIVLDLSGSMDSQVGVETTRIAGAKVVIGQFVSNHPSDRIGLIWFSDFSQLEWPALGFDHQPLLKRLETLRTYGGTAIDEGLLTALKHLAETGSSGNGAVILLSDGGSSINEDNWEEIIRLARETRTRLYWIWIGNDEDTFVQNFRYRFLQLGGVVYNTSPAQLQEAFEDISRLKTETVIEVEEKTLINSNYGPLLLVVIITLLVAALFEFGKEV